MNAIGICGQRPEGLLNILQYVRQPPQQGCPPLNINSAKAEKPWLIGIHMKVDRIPAGMGIAQMSPNFFHP
jgi:hypothetical protein